MAKAEFKFPISGERSTSRIRSYGFFDSTYVEPDLSPIDLFNNNMTTYLKLLGCFILDTESMRHVSLVGEGKDEWNKLSNLVLLGFISSVESYCRCLIRKLLLVDLESKRQSYSCLLTYGAALHHDRVLLPEALIEDASFSCAKNIKETIKSVTGINLNNLQKFPALSSAFDNFDFVCQLRHCVVHRSGLLGSKNALALGFDEFRSYLEKPIKLDFSVIQEAATVCNTLVKELNDKMFSDILVRSTSFINWNGDLRTDKVNFDPYFFIFSPISEHGKRVESYRAFIAACNIKV